MLHLLLLPLLVLQGGNRPSTEVPANVESHLDVVTAAYGDRKLHADIFVPNDRKGLRPAVVVVHGGGWLKGDKTKFRALALKLASLGYVTAAVEYRLGGEAKFPAAIHDCNAAVRFLRANAKRYRIDPEPHPVVDPVLRSPNSKTLSLGSGMFPCAL